MRSRVPGVYQRGSVWWVTYYAYGRRVREPVGPSHKEAVRVRAQRIADVAAGRLGIRRGRKAPTLGEFVETWRRDAVHLKPSTTEGYEKLLKNHLLPAFADHPLPAITREAVKRLIAEKAREQRHSYSKRNPNPDRPLRSQKSIKNMVALLSGLLESAASDYGLLDANPLRGILRRKYFPADAHRIRDRRVQFLEPDDFKRAVERLAAAQPRVAEMVLVASLAGLRWGEQVALRIDEDIDFRRNKIRVTRSLYKRVAQTPKTEQSIGDVDMVPTVRRVLQAAPRKTGLVFSEDGRTPIGNGSWIKRQWRKAQTAVGIRRPIAWHALRHQFVTLLIAAGKHPKYIAKQARHYSAGFTLDRYGDLFETVPITPVEWIDDLLWPSGFDVRRAQFGHKTAGTQAETRVPA